MSINDYAPLFGLISAEAAVHAGQRRIFELWVNINPKKRNIQLWRLLRLCEIRKIPVVHMSRDEMTEGCGDGGHGGVVLWVDKRPFCVLESLLSKGKPLFLIEGIEDPYNFGTLVRSLYAAGVYGLVLPQRNWMTASGIVARASAGTSEYMPMAIFQDAAHIAAALPPCFRFVIAEEHKLAVDLYNADLKGSLLVGIGGEKRGLSAEITKLANEKIRIPYGQPFKYSLPTHVAATVIAFEILRQTRQT